jgi:mannose-6-phosphate isomerase-like protein (cupin superfamily)
VVDALTDVLTLAAVQGSVAAAVVAGGDWGLRLDAVPGAAFHAITVGTAHLMVDGHPPLLLSPGDVVLLPSGVPHVLASRPDAPVRPFDHVRAEAAANDGDEVSVGDLPATTRILCAAYRHDPAATLATFSLLPEGSAGSAQLAAASRRRTRTPRTGLTRGARPRRQRVAHPTAPRLDRVRRVLLSTALLAAWVG